MKRKISCLSALATFVIASLFAICAFAAGPGSFGFEYPSGLAIQVWTYEPETLSPKTKVVFVMHGVGRNGEDYRDQWVNLAEENGFLLIVPEFSQADFPGAENYNLGGVLDNSGAITPETGWAYSYIEALFDDVREKYGLNAQSYAIYGHSAGAQFVHRFVLYKPEARASAVVVANAGWYEMPDKETAFPYGLKDSGVDEERLRGFLKKPLTVLLGDADIDPNARSLRRTPEALAQGANRFERGHAFFAAGKKAAEEAGAEFNWSLAIAPGVAHDNAKMAPHAVKFLLAD